MTTQEQLKQYKDIVKKEVFGLESMFYNFTIDDMYIAGGAIRSLIEKNQPKDIDIFFKSHVNIDQVKDYFKKYHPTAFITENAITLWIDNKQFQFIITTKGTPLQVIHEFDFTINMNYFDFQDNILYVHHKSAILFKKLEINLQCRNKLGTLGRIPKFVKRGYSVPDKMNLVELGVLLTREEPVVNFEKLQENSKFHYSEEEYTSLQTIPNYRPYNKVVKNHKGSAV